MIINKDKQKKKTLKFSLFSLVQAIFKWDKTNSFI